MSQNIKPHSGGIILCLKLKAEFQFRTKYITSNQLEKLEAAKAA